MDSNQQHDERLRRLHRAIAAPLKFSLNRNFSKAVDAETSSLLQRRARRHRRFRRDQRDVVRERHRRLAQGRRRPLGQGKRSKNCRRK